MKEPNPEDPRVKLSRHSERGEARFSFTYSDIARVTGLSPRTVRSAAAAKPDGSPGELDASDLVSLAAFVARRVIDGPPRGDPFHADRRKLAGWKRRHARANVTSRKGSPR